MRRQFFVGVQRGRRRVVQRRQPQLVFLIRAREFCGHEVNSVQFEAVDLIEPRAFQHALLVPGVDREPLYPRHLGIRVQAEFVRLRQSILLHFQFHDAGRLVFERNLHFEFVRFPRFPSCLQLFAARGGDADFLDARRSRRLQVNGIIAAHNHRAPVFRAE